MANCPNDNPHDRSHTPREASLRLSIRLIIRSSALLFIGLVPQRSIAQSPTSLVTDASVLPRGAVGIRFLTSWTRWDEYLGNGTDAQGRPQNLAATLATGSLDPVAVPSFAIAQSMIRDLSGLPNFNLSAGNVIAAASARSVSAPLIAQYGLTSRLTVGVVVPLVETRTTVFAQLNPRTGLASVGPNPALLNAAQLASNAALVQSLRGAAAQLQQALTQCQSNSAGANCATILGQQSAVQGLIQTTGTFTSGLEALYGTGVDHPGQQVVPLSGEPAQAGIDAQILALRGEYQSFLGSDVVTGAIAGAGAPAANAQLQSLLTSLGHDTLGSIDRSSIGDISVGATLQLANTYGALLGVGDTAAAVARRLAYRFSVNGSFRIGTGEPGSRNKLFDTSTGYGQQGVEVGGAGDFRLGRFAATTLGSYTLQLGTVDVARDPNPGNALLPLLAAPATGSTYSAGNVLTLSFIPRIALAHFLTLNGEYQVIHTGADQYGGTAAGLAPGLSAATAQQIGFGFSYSTVASNARGPGEIPFEVIFNHLETIAGSGGPVAKTFRDQVELRVYLTR